MSTSSVRNHKGPVVHGLSLGAKELLPALCSLAVALGLASPVQAQDPSANKTNTPLDDRLLDSLNRLRDSAIEFWFEHATLDPSFIELGKQTSLDDLQRATWRWHDSVMNLRMTNDLFWDAEANTLEARTVVKNLESQLLQAQYAVDFSKSLASSMPAAGVEFHLKQIQAASARVLDIESQLALARFTLHQASSYRNYLGLELAFAKFNLWRAQTEMKSARRSVFYFTEVAPRVNIGFNVAAEHIPVVFIAHDAYDLLSNPVYRVQTADAASSTTDLLLETAGYLLRKTFSGAHFLPGLVSFDQTVNGIRTTYNAFQHQHESVDLAFSGVLSQLNLPRYAFVEDFHDRNGSFFLGAANGPLAVYSRWTSRDGITTDRFDTQSWYRFSGLETTSGHVLTGSGNVVRERIEQHDPFQFNPILNSLNIFTFGDSFNSIETTRRNESYNDSFNGRLANQGIQRAAEFNPHPDISVAPSARHPYGQDDPKHPPFVSNPPTSPPPPIPSALPSRSEVDTRPPSTGGIYLGGKQNYSEHQGTDKQFDRELASAEVVFPKKEKKPQ